MLCVVFGMCWVVVFGVIVLDCIELLCGVGVCVVWCDVLLWCVVL